MTHRKVALTILYTYTTERVCSNVTVRKTMEKAWQLGTTLNFLDSTMYFMTLASGCCRQGCCHWSAVTRTLLLERRSRKACLVLNNMPHIYVAGFAHIAAGSCHSHTWITPSPTWKYETTWDTCPIVGTCMVQYYTYIYWRRNKYIYIQGILWSEWQGNILQ